jgi:hypothetical protein
LEYAKGSDTRSVEPFQFFSTHSYLPDSSNTSKSSDSVPSLCPTLLPLLLDRARFEHVRVACGAGLYERSGMRRPGPRKRELWKTDEEISSSGLGSVGPVDGHTLMIENCYMRIQPFMESADQLLTGRCHRTIGRGRVPRPRSTWIGRLKSARS